MLKPYLPVTSTIKGLRGSFQTWHDLEVKGRQAQSPGHKYLPTHSSLRALGGPGLRLGGTPINPPADRLSLCPPCHRAFLGAAAASAAPSGGRDKLRSWSEGRSRGWCGRVSGWEQGEQARPSAGWGAEPPASPAGGQSTDTRPLHGALRWLFPHSPVRLRGLSTPTLMPSNRDSALRGRRARSVRRDLMGPSSA